MSMFERQWGRMVHWGGPDITDVDKGGGKQTKIAITLNYSFSYKENHQVQWSK